MDEYVSAEDLLTAWRDAIRAAELTERLAAVATDAVRQADIRTNVLLEIAEMAERAADAANRAAVRARGAATEAAGLADTVRGQEIPTRDAAAIARQTEADAATAYHQVVPADERPDAEGS